MKYTHIVFDVDGTLVDSQRAVRDSLRQTLADLHLPEPTPEDIRFAMHAATAQVIARLGLPASAAEVMTRHFIRLSRDNGPMDGIPDVISALKERGCTLGIVTSRDRPELENDPALMPLLPAFADSICVEDTENPKPSPDPLLLWMRRNGADPEHTLFIGDSAGDLACARAAGVDSALAVWGARPGMPLTATHYPLKPEELLPIIDGRCNRWIAWAQELQFIAQAGVTYSRDPFDQDRFARLREISAEIMAEGADMEINHVRDVFCSETGFQTPKISTRAALFRDDRILLVQEKNGLWSLPGGWVDVNQSVGANAVKEVFEESGIIAECVKVIALQDRNRHNRPVYAHGICNVYVLCRPLGGEFIPNTETLQCGWFALDDLPPMDERRTTAEQVRMCFAARADDWQTALD